MTRAICNRMVKVVDFWPQSETLLAMVRAPKCPDLLPQLRMAAMIFLNMTTRSNNPNYKTVMKRKYKTILS